MWATSKGRGGGVVKFHNSLSLNCKQLCRVFAHSNVRRDSRRALRFYGRLCYIYVKNV